MKVTLIGVLIVTLLLVSTSEQAKKRNRYRGKKPKGSCHLKELEKCLESLERYKNDTETYKLLKESHGFNQICSTVQDTIGCYKLFIERCGTPLQYEFFDFTIEYFTKSVDKFCKAGPTREAFLKHSPCLVDKVIGTQDFKTTCNHPYLATVERLKKNDTLDDRLDSICCSYNRWEDCFLGAAEKSCGKGSRGALFDFLDKAVAGIVRLVCNHKEFDFKTDKCKLRYAPSGAKVDVQKSDHPIIKYLALYFGYLLN